MSSTFVSYAGGHAFIGGRPLVDIVCYGLSPSTSTPYRAAALLDTGADYLTLPDAVAPHLGIVLSHFSTTTVATASGRATPHVVPGFFVELEGRMVTVTAHFMPLARDPFGLTAMLAAFDVGLDVRQWLFTP